jgi:Spy/CpxP family protein refolding chaperone
MRHTIGGRIATALILFASVAPAYGQRPAPPTGILKAPPYAWWKSETVQKEISLTADQAARIDKIWETTRPELRQESDELSRLEAKLSRLFEIDADETVLTREIDRVETARASANKTRSLMLMQMRKVLTPDQRTRLRALGEKRQRDERDGSSAQRDEQKRQHE